VHRSRRPVTIGIARLKTALLAVLALAAPVERALAKPENGAVAFAGRRLGKPTIHMRDPDLGVSGSPQGRLAGVRRLPARVRAGPPP
jgi:hypothetical protein